MILVDYRCDNCLGTSEHLVSNPVPPTVSCPACLSSARRRFAPVGLGGRAAAPVDRPVQSNRALCRDNPDVPGLCHMTPDAARTWVARARRDNRALERELAHQERTLKENPGKVLEPVSHTHGPTHGHGHGHGRSPGPGAGTGTSPAPGDGGSSGAQSPGSGGASPSARTGG
ncbi:MAG: hypothetical protein ACT4O0_13115 [Pseudonocardia sp.]